VHRRLADALIKPEFQAYDYILIDCPPNFNIVTKTAIVASDHVLIPAKADYLSTLGISYLQRSLDQLVSDYNEYSQLSPSDEDDTINPRVLGVVFTMMQFYARRPIAALRPYVEETRSLGVPVFDKSMRENKTHFADAPQYGIPLVLLNTPASAYIVHELEELVSEFEERLGRN
jgi:chromosome partitioning protein